MNERRSERSQCSVLEYERRSGRSNHFAAFERDNIALISSTQYTVLMLDMRSTQ